MSFWKALFGRSKNAQVEEDGLGKHLEYLNSLRAPALELFPATQAGQSRLGGLPSLPDDLAWPEWNGKPLSFLCQLDLSEIPVNAERHGLPETGMLFFFFDQEQEAWGTDPGDFGAWRVLLAAAPRATPRLAPAGLAPTGMFKEKAVRLTPVDTYPDPDWQEESVLQLPQGAFQSDQYVEPDEGMVASRRAHQLFGHASPVQSNDMELDCEQAANGLNPGVQSHREEERAKALESARRDWTLLLQLDTDDEAGMMWGDCGRLYFWMRRQDLAARDFGKCWMIMQCC